LKQKEPAPDVYRVTYRLSKWRTKSERFFSAFTATEAFTDYHHAFSHGHVNGDRSVVLSVDLYDRFAGSWINKTGEVKLTDVHEHAKISRGYIRLNR